MAGASASRALLIVGDPGIGKSHLVRAASDMVRGDASIAVLAGECLRLTEQMPLLPVITALRSAHGRDDGAWMRAAIDDCPNYVRSALVAILPELLEQDDASAPLAAGDRWERQRLFAAIGTILAALGRARATAIVIEDVHWADSSSLDLLDYLLASADEATPPMVLTARDDDPDAAAANAEWLTRMRTRDGVDVMHLQALSVDETAQQINLLTGQDPEPGFAAGVFARSEGNALFTELLVGDARLPIPVSLPANLRALLNVRLADLDEDTDAVAATLAIAARPLDIASISTLTDLDETIVVSALHRLNAQRLLRADAGTAHTLRHALLAEAVVERMLPAERATLHRRVGRHLGASDDSAAAEVAEHWRQAQEPAEELRWRVLAAGQAVSARAPAQAASQWVRVLELWDRVEDATAIAGTSRGEVYLAALGELADAGLELDASVLVESALEEPHQDFDRTVRAELLRRAAWYRGERDAALGLRTSADALELFEEADPSADFVNALEQHGRMLLQQGQAAAGASVLDRALQVSAELPDHPMHSVLLVRRASCAMALGDVATALQLLERAWSPDVDRGSMDDRLDATIGHTDMLFKLGRFAEVPALAAAALDPMVRLGLPENVLSALVRGNTAQALVALGKLDEARQFLAPLANQSVGIWMVEELFAELDALAGDLDGAARRLESVGDLTGYSIERRHDVTIRRAEVDLWRNHPDAALQLLRDFLSAAGPTDMSATCGWSLVLTARAAADIAASLIGDTRRRREEALSTEISGLLATMRADPFTQPEFPATGAACAATWRAETARLRDAAGAGDWEIAANAWGDLHMPHRVAYCRWRQSEAVLATPGNRSRARQVLLAADRLAEGHEPLKEVIRSTAARARITLDDVTSTDTRAARLPAKPEPVAERLTSRERAVLQLLAQGKTNSEIGKELYISPKTASVHVTSILRKLGVHSRTHAAAVAERTGLLADQ
jgi:DNA-binding CsgD family transcriptional regulator/tetratricopeptide (TPR) repeat protein